MTIDPSADPDRRADPALDPSADPHHAGDRHAGLRRRLFGIARTTAALTLLIGGVIAGLGWLATSSEETAWDVIGVILLLAAVLPTLLGAIGLLAVGDRADRSSSAPPRR